ncbi:MAG: cysteine synthase A [Spirochaetia bacterium]|nr:cysteine synthase A [Spirochaetia bacterium]
MEKILKNFVEAVGNTPLIELCNIEKDRKLYGKLLAKVESFNPAGSAKDRAALYMIEDAEKKGLLKEGSVIIEPTSGNTGIGLAWIGGVKGYRVILTMPDTMSAERRMLLKAYGAEIILTDGAAGMKGAIERAQELAASIPGAFIPGQFDNPANSRAHFETTGPEIWKAADGKVDYLVAGVGTGGTLIGSGRYLKSQDPSVKVVAVEPADSPVISGGKAAPHKLQGIGANFIPALFDASICDRVITAEAEDAFDCARELVKKEGILAGISAGAALWAGIQLAAEKENARKNIVVIIPDTGERYLSTGIFG